MAARIVTGVDGSEGSIAALRWAFTEAALREATVVAVHVWHYPYAGDAAGMAALAIRQEDLEQTAHEVLSKSLELAGPAPPGVVVEAVLANGAAAPALLAAAEGADLLVVGTRGRGGFKGLLLGSVSQQCAQHAPCPVVIVPPTS